jgi:hypothetical protein
MVYGGCFGGKPRLVASLTTRVAFGTVSTRCAAYQGLPGPPIGAGFGADSRAGGGHRTLAVRRSDSPAAATSVKFVGASHVQSCSCAAAAESAIAPSPRGRPISTKLGRAGKAESSSARTS